MRSLLLPCVLSLCLVACSSAGPGAATRYTYPGCPDEDDGCGGLAALDCALGAIRTKHAACTTDADCVAVTLENDCSGFSACSLAVNRDAVAAFTTEAGKEVARYCARADKCVRMPACVPVAPACQGGQCAMVMTAMDGGR